MWVWIVLFHLGLVAIFLLATGQSAALLGLVIGCAILVVGCLAFAKLDRAYMDRQRRLGRVDWPLK